MGNKETAEQKLLRLIEATDAKDGSKGKGQTSSPAMQELQLAATPSASSRPSSAPAVAPTPVAASAAPVRASAADEAQRVLSSVKSVGVSPISISVPPILDSLMAILKGAGSLAKSPSSFGLKDVNKVLAILILIFAVVFSMSLFNNLRVSKQELQFDVEELAAPKGGIVLPTFKDIAEYLQTVSHRNIFQPYEKKIVEEKTDEETPLTPKVAEKISTWKLVGVSWIDTPESTTAMIEDGQTSMTYFVKTGDVFKGVKVESIYADRVVVSFDGEIMDLPLY